MDEADERVRDRRPPEGDVAGFGTPIDLGIGGRPLPPGSLGVDWSLSPETLAAIEEVEANIGMARAMRHTILTD